MESKVKLHGFDPEEAILEVMPRAGQEAIRLEDIKRTIKEHGESVALVLFGGVNYYTGQVFDMEAITKEAHKVGAYAGFDLAHAAGNITLKMHEWNIDFACWCTYKYLNSGPGSVGGAFVHQKHITNKDLPRLAGWWGNQKENRFKMEKGFHPIPTAEGWQLSNAPVFLMAVHKAAIDMFDEAGMEAISKKGKLLSGYLIYLLQDFDKRLPGKNVRFITPTHEDERGCQVSIVIKESGRELFEYLKENGISAGWREPEVIRVAPVALYNTFEEVWRFVQLIEQKVART
jgi:kynureninase